MPRVRAFLHWLRRRWRAVYVALAVLTLSAVAGGLLFAWSGIYNVAASSGHWLIVDRFLRFGMTNSVEFHAPDITPPNLSDDDLVRLGAGHYHAGCAYCHGAPGLPITPVAEHMLPAPPVLTGRVFEWTDQELFWLVKHGLKYTGMPGWPVQDRDDEVWALVAFLRTLPDATGEDYRNLALAGVDIEPQGGEDIATGSAPDTVSACARCHGGARSGPTSRLVPILHGQPTEMLRKALRDYASGARSSGIMQTAVSGLSGRQLDELADYYAGLAIERGEGTSSEHGRFLAEHGDPARNIPACLSCHSHTALPIYPRLAGQNARYIANRIRTWQAGRTDRTDTAAIMMPIARLLDDRDIEAVAAYFSSLPDSGRAAP